MTNPRIDEEIAGLAARQHGVITRQQLLALGLGRGGIHARVERGSLHAVHAGVYLVGHTAEARYARHMAAVLACGQDAVISHRTAAAMWSLATRATPPQVEVTVPGDRTLRRAGVRVYGTALLSRADVRLLEAIPVTSPARTIVDLSRLLRTGDLEQVVADAERRGLVARHELLTDLVRHRGRRGIATLRSVLDEPDLAVTRSEAERRLLRLIRAASLPSPATNARVGGHEVDFFWPRERVIVEVDGYQWHADRAAFERDRLRDAELQAVGNRVVRVTWRQLQREPRAVVARIASVLRRAVDLSAQG